MSLGSRLRSRREKLHKTQIDAARELGISNVQLSRYESDERKPDPELLRKFAEYYNTNTDYLVGHTSDPSPPGESKTDDEILNEIINDPEISVFFKDFLSSPEQHKRDLIRLWKVIKESEKDRKPGDIQGE